MKESYITNHHIISPLGFGSELNFKKLMNLESGIKKHQRPNGESIYSSAIDKEDLDMWFSELGHPDQFTRLEKLMICSIDALLNESDFQISDRTCLMVSTTKGNIDVLDPGSNFYTYPTRAYLSELGKQINDFFNFKNEAIVLSNACVSGILAVSVADRLIQSEVYDDVIIVSGDLLTDFILSGFNSFQAISDTPCRPFSKNRDGITIGEAIATVLVRSEKSKGRSENCVRIIGSGSCNDANHISGPSRTGEGLYLSVKSALNEAKIDERNIDYISAHGTATVFNDEMEAIAFSSLNMSDIPLNSLKGYYGHTLGASGLLETIIGIKSSFHNTLIPSYGFDELGVSEKVNVIQEIQKKKIDIFLKTASGFGGCNAAVLFQKVT